MEDDFVTISKEEFEALKDDSAFLAHLTTNGVFSWDGVDDAIRSYLNAVNNDE